MNNIHYSVFTKPWPNMSLSELGDWVSELGFDGIELPVRPGFQVTPETVHDLPAAARTLAACGISIMSVAGPTDEQSIAACAEAGVPVIRVMARINSGESYVLAERRLRSEYDDLVPLLDRYGVTLGVQNHCDRFVSNAVGLRQLLKGYDPKHIAIVWDAAHEALEGSHPDLALDVVWDQLCMVNLKNAIRKQVDTADDDFAKWQVYWTAGNAGFASWPQVISELKRRDYSGSICLTAEYSNHEAVNELIREDIMWAKALFSGHV